MTTQQLLADKRAKLAKLDARQAERANQPARIPDKFVYDVCTFGRWWGVSAAKGRAA